MGSALELPYPDDAFNQSLSLLVLMLIPQPEKIASEMRRVTRPGGTVAACTWDGEGLEMTRMFWEEAIKLNPDAKARVERPRHYNRQGQLTELWQATGLEDIEETALDIQTEFSCFDDYWLPFLNGVGPTGVYIAEFSAERRGALREGG